METPTPKSPFAIRNVRMFIAFRLFFNARFYYPVFTILFLDFGLTLSQFAVLNAVWAATIVLLEVPSGALADTMGRRNLLVAAGVLMVVEIALIAFVPLGNPTLIFAVFVVNRVLSGAAEAAASGADEAIAFDSLKKEGRAEDWGRVLEWQMRMKSVGFIIAMSLGAAVYDPNLVQRVADALGLTVAVARESTIRFPLFLTLLMAVFTLISTLRMREVTAAVENGDASCPETVGCGKSVVGAFRLTLQAGSWILSTPFVLVIILFGLLFDHILRMVVTMVSQYYRLIELPEAAFGLIGSGLALLGFFIPRLARHMTEKYTPAANLGAMAVMTCVGLFGLTFFIPIFGIIPMVILSSVMYFTGFFVSHYLNHMTDSGQRATVLSFKGLSFNLAYGCIGMMYSFLLAWLRSDVQQVQAGLSGTDVVNAVFKASIGWFPWYFLLMLTLALVFARRRLQSAKPYKQPGPQAADRPI